MRRIMTNYDKRQIRIAASWPILPPRYAATDTMPITATMTATMDILRQRPPYDRRPYFPLLWKYSWNIQTARHSAFTCITQKTALHGTHCGLPGGRGVLVQFDNNTVSEPMSTYSRMVIVCSLHFIRYRTLILHRKMYRSDGLIKNVLEWVSANA